MLIETGWTPEQVDNASESLLRNMMIYKAAKKVSTGEFN